MSLSRFKTAEVQLDCRDGVFVRELNALHLAEVADAVQGMAQKPQVEQVRVMALVCLLCCCDAELRPLFETTEAVLEEPFELIRVCMGASLAVNGMVEELAESAAPGN